MNKKIVFLLPGLLVIPYLYLSFWFGLSLIRSLVFAFIYALVMIILQLLFRFNKGASVFVTILKYLGSLFFTLNVTIYYLFYGSSYTLIPLILFDVLMVALDLFLIGLCVIELIIIVKEY